MSAVGELAQLAGRSLRSENAVIAAQVNDTLGSTFNPSKGLFNIGTADNKPLSAIFPQEQHFSHFNVCIDGVVYSNNANRTGAQALPLSSDPQKLADGTITCSYLRRFQIGRLTAHPECYGRRNSQLHDQHAAERRLCRKYPPVACASGPAHGNHGNPLAVNHSPAPNAIGVSPNTVIAFEVRDDLSGVDSASMRLRINASLVSPNLQRVTNGFVVNFKPNTPFARCNGSTNDNGRPAGLQTRIRSAAGFCAG